jgi:hypothetical protein
MREPTAPVPPFAGAGTTHWGIGWCLGRSGDYDMAGHFGGTLGQYTYLRTFPGRGTAFALFTNSPSAKLFDAVEARLSPELAGAPVPQEPPKQEFRAEPRRYAGTYANIANDYRVEKTDKGLEIHMVSKVGLPGADAMLEPWCEDVFSLRAPGTPFDGQKVMFLGDEKSAPAEFIRMSLRMARRTG